MRCNLGKADRILRVVTGFIIIEAGVHLEAWWGIIGIVPILTAAIGWCPFYAPFKVLSKQSKPQ